jgi:hypothetical protein
MLAAMMVLAACGGGAHATTTTTAPADTAKPAAKPKVVAVAPPAPAFDTAAAAGTRPLVRETYHYEGGARDPFKPLIAPVDRGPELPDLRLVAIIYDDQHASGSIATFRDIGDDHRYTLNPGQRLGRLSVVSITANTVKLRQDDFGTEREQTYSLRKPEDEQP